MRYLFLSIAPLHIVLFFVKSFYINLETVLKKLLCFLMVIFVMSSCVSNKTEKKMTIPVLSPRTGGSIRQLSHYLPSLKKSPGDTTVYVLDSKAAGPSMLIVAGVHGNELSGIRAAEIFVKMAVVEKGKVFVIPHLNKPGFFAGSRNVPPEYQGVPDPDLYTPPGGTVQQLEGIEQRNINRAYPGSDDMGLAQKIALAVMNLIISENVKIAFDLHEAPPSSYLAWMIISNPKHTHVVSGAVLDLEAQGIIMKKEVSSKNSGLSHREWGDRTQTFAFLIETADPQMSSDPSPYIDDPKYTLERRSLIQLETIRHLVANSNKFLSAPLIFSGIPVYSENSSL